MFNLPIPPDCSCEVCQSLCTRPGWFTPDEALKAIHAGFANKLMLDWWVNDDGSELYILGPALVGYEGTNAPWWPSGLCCLLQDGKCMIHTTDFKPIECRLAYHEKTHDVNVHKSVAMLWNTPEAQSIIDLWKIKV